MGYLDRPIRRSDAAVAKRSLLEVTRDVDPASWMTAFEVPHDPARTFLRFVVEQPTGGYVGLFRGSDLIEHPDVLPAIASRSRAAYQWFNRNMKFPTSMQKTAVCWFRSDATECIGRLRELIEIYRVEGRQVWMRATRDPGRIIYADALQVAAVPRPTTRWSSSCW